MPISVVMDVYQCSYRGLSISKDAYFTVKMIIWLRPVMIRHSLPLPCCCWPSWVALLENTPRLTSPSALSNHKLTIRLVSESRMGTGNYLPESLLLPLLASWHLQIVDHSEKSLISDCIIAWLPCDTSPHSYTESLLAFSFRISLMVP